MPQIAKYTSFEEMKKRDNVLGGDPTEEGGLFNTKVVKEDGGFFRKGGLWYTQPVTNVVVVFFLGLTFLGPLPFYWCNKAVLKGGWRGHSTASNGRFITNVFLMAPSQLSGKNAHGCPREL